jgi:uncharacterized protein YbjT (DUF2867 family)
MKILITGATGMVGEGVLLHCLNNDEVEKVLMVNRKHYEYKHSKLEELILPNFNDLADHSETIEGYDACFYCAGVSSIGMKEDKYTQIIHTTTLSFAETLVKVNPTMVFTFVTGMNTNAKGSQMWQRVKGKTEEDLMHLDFRGQYNFRPGFMSGVKGQQNIKWFVKPLIAAMVFLFPKQSLSLSEVGQAMINAVKKGYDRPILEVDDIKKLSKM